MNPQQMLWKDGSKTAHIPIHKLSLGKLIGIKHFIKKRPRVIEFYGISREDWNAAIFKEVGVRQNKCIGFILAQNDRKVEDIIIKMGVFTKQHFDNGRRIIQDFEAKQKAENFVKTIETINQYQEHSRTQRTIGELIKS